MNLLVCDVFKVVPLELAMSSFLVCLFGVVLLECTTSSNMVRGSIIRSRARWYEQGERNTKYFLK